MIARRWNIKKPLIAMCFTFFVPPIRFGGLEWEVVSEHRVGDVINFLLNIKIGRTKQNSQRSHDESTRAMKSATPVVSNALQAIPVEGSHTTALTYIALRNEAVPKTCTLIHDWSSGLRWRQFRTMRRVENAVIRLFSFLP